MNQSAFERIETLVKRPASMPYDAIIAEVFLTQVTVRKVANDQILQRVLIADHIDKSKLKKGVPVRLGEHLGQPIVLAIFPQLEGDINYAGKGSVIPAPPTVTVAALPSGWRVTWTAVPGADRYRVYRNDTPDETTPDDLDYVTGTTLLVPYEGTYIYFAVRACSGLNESELSAWVTDAVAPPTPNTFAALSNVGGHLLTIGADDVAMMNPGFKYFEIEQAEDGSGTGAVSLGYFYYPNDFPSLRPFGVGTVKYYRIRAIDWAGNASGWTAWDFTYAGQSEIQDKFDGYGNRVAGALESLWYLFILNCELPESWTFGGFGALDSLNAVQGNGTAKVLAGSGFDVYASRSGDDLSIDSRFTNDDYVIVTVYSEEAGDNAVLIFWKDSSTYASVMGTVAVGYNHLKLKRSDFTITGGFDWTVVNRIYLLNNNATGLMWFDDLRIVKADPDDAATYNDTGKSWDRAAHTGTDVGEWHIYEGNRTGEPSKPFSYGQIKIAASPATWYLSHKPLETTDISTGTIQAGVYLRATNGKAGLAFYIKDALAGSWDMYAVEADSAGDTIKLVKWVGGTRTEIASASFTFAPNQILWLGADFKDYDADDGRIKIYASFSEGNLLQAANLAISAQDTSVGSGGSVGLLSYQANARFVNFRAGSPAHAETADVAFALDGPIIAGETRRVRYNRDSNRFEYSDDGSTWASVRPEVASGNYVITPSVASNNLTVALKTLAGADPSASDPVVARIGNSLVTIAAALGTTKTAGTNWCNAGSAELATKDTDYFVYLIQETGAAAGTKIGFSRIPWARTMGDFVNTTTSEKYIAGNWTNFNSTDAVEVIGRFNATLSAGAGYTWSIGTAVVISRQIFDTRWLSYAAVVTPGSGAFGAVGTVTTLYNVSGRVLAVAHDVTITTNGTGGQDLRISLPFTPASQNVAAVRELNLTGKAAFGSVSGALIFYVNYDNTYPVASGTRFYGGGAGIRLV